MVKSLEQVVKLGLADYCKDHLAVKINFVVVHAWQKHPPLHYVEGMLSNILTGSDLGTTVFESFC